MRANQKMNGTKFPLAAIVAAIALSTLASCGGGKAKNGSLVLDSTSAGTNTSPTSSNFSVSASFSIPTPNYLHSTTSTDWSAPCQVPAASLTYPPVASGTLSCMLEASEEDLYLGAMTLSYSVPSGVCEYLLVQPYYAWQYQPNVGPLAFTKNINSSGAVTSVSVSQAGNSALASDPGVVIKANKAVCQYDYSVDGGPNCCTGNYTATVNTTPASGPVTTTTESGSWGGSIGACATGPGIAFSTAKDSDGLPKFPATPAIQGYANSVVVSAPTDKGFNSALWVANYFNPATSPGGLFNPAYPSSSANARGPNPYYQFICMTHGKEVKGRILLQVRKWNLASELAVRGVWNTGGNETNGGGPIKDYNGWEDYSTPTSSPGSDF